MVSPLPCRNFGTVDDQILCFFSQVYKECAVSGYTNQKITVFFRVLLCIQQCISVYYVELYMESSHDLFGTQQCYQLLLTRFIFDELRCQLQVEQCSCSAVCVVYITNGFENSCRAMLIIAWVRRHTVCQRLLAFLPEGSAHIAFP